MNKVFKTKLSLLAFALYSGCSAAGSVTIPNTFVGGAKASASEVNTNFDAIKTAVDDNAADISANISNITANTNAIGSLGGFAVSVNGVQVGILQRYPIYHSQPLATLLPSNYMVVLSPIGEGPYPTNAAGSPSNEIVYTSVDCSGQPYAKSESVETLTVHGLGQLYANQGLEPQALYYIPAGSTAESLTYNSKDVGFGCVSESFSTDLYKVYPNDSNVTGVTNAQLTGPISISN